MQDSTSFRQRRTVFQSVWPESVENLDAFFEEHGASLNLDRAKFCIMKYEEYKSLYGILHSDRIAVSQLQEGVLGEFFGKVMNLALEIELADAIRTADSIERIPVPVDINLSRIKAHFSYQSKGAIIKLSTRGTVGFCVNVITPDVMRIVIRPTGLVRVQLHRAVRKSTWAALMGLEWVLQRLMECNLPAFYVHRLQICNQSCSVSLPDLLRNMDPHVAQLYAKSWSAAFGRGKTSQAPKSAASALRMHRQANLAEAVSGSSSSSSAVSPGAATTTTTTQGFGAAAAKQHQPQTIWSHIAHSYYAWYEGVATGQKKLKSPPGTVLPSQPPNITRRSLAGGRDLVNYSYTPPSPQSNFQTYIDFACTITGQTARDLVKQMTDEQEALRTEFDIQLSNADPRDVALNPVVYTAPTPGALELLDVVQPLFFESTRLTSVLASQTTEGSLLSRIEPELLAGAQMLNENEDDGDADAMEQDEPVHIRIDPRALALFKSTSGMDSCHLYLDRWRPCMFRSPIVNMARKVVFLEASSRFGVLTTRNSLGKAAAAAAFGEFVSYAFKLRYMEYLVIHILWIMRLHARATLREYDVTVHQALEKVVEFYTTVYMAQYSNTLIEFKQRSHELYITQHLTEAARLDVQTRTLNALRTLFLKCCPGGAAVASQHHHHQHDTGHDLVTALRQLDILSRSDSYYRKIILLDTGMESGHQKLDTGANAAQMKKENAERERLAVLSKLNPYINKKLDITKYATVDSQMKSSGAKLQGAAKRASSQAKAATPAAAPDPTVCIGTLLMLHMDPDTVMSHEEDIDLLFYNVLTSTSTRPGPRGCIYHYLQAWE